MKAHVARLLVAEVKGPDVGGNFSLFFCVFSLFKGIVFWENHIFFLIMFLLDL